MRISDFYYFPFFWKEYIRNMEAGYPVEISNIFTLYYTIEVL
jgi:hypothetical protein